MLGIPEKYRKTQKIDVKTFIKKDLKIIEKKRLKESLKQVILTHQIYGEDIPSLITDEYNCQVVMFLDIEIENIKDASFIGNIIQSQIKSLCVLNIHDRNTGVYYFTEKRLNMQDSQNIVIENIVITKESSIYFEDDTKQLIQKHLDFNNIILKENKLTFYRELMAKGFILSKYNFSLEGSRLVESNLWYNSRKVKELLNGLKEIEKLKLLLKKTKVLKEKAAINKEIKMMNEKIASLL